jgi:adenosylcobinamide-GDP ribazoletransferase
MGFILLLGFYTRLPVPHINFDEAKYRKAMPLLPLVGLVIGLLLALLAAGIDALGLPTLVRGAILLAAYVVITGGLHLDGLADSCDGLFAGRGRERALEIMKDSHIGSFGVLALIVAGVGYLALFSYASLAAIFCGAIVGRIAPAVLSTALPHARQAGMAVLAGRAKVGQTIAMSAAMLLLATVLGGLLAASVLTGALVLVAAIVALALVGVFGLYLKHQLGGITGDTLGAAIELSQVAFLLAMQVAMQVVALATA